MARGVHFRGKLRLLDALGVGPSNRDLVPPEVQAVECIEGIVMATEQNRDVMFRRFYTDGLTDDEVFVALANLLSPGQVFWDVGANYGFMAIYVDRHFRGAVRSVAFEPSPTVLKELRRNVDINRCKSVAVEPTCLTDRVGPLTFFVSEDHSWNATLVASMAAASGQDRAIEVEGSTIDEMVTRLPPPDVLKIDVEGAEHLVVEGGAAYLRSRRPPIVAEFNLESMGKSGLDGRDFFRMFHDLGYVVHAMRRPWVGLHQWSTLHRVDDPRELAALSNVVLLPRS